MVGVEPVNNWELGRQKIMDPSEKFSEHSKNDDGWLGIPVYELWLS